MVSDEQELQTRKPAQLVSVQIMKTNGSHIISLSMYDHDN